MKNLQKLELLKKIYDIHDTLASDAQTVCHPGCAACCTCNVTATTLEGLLLYRFLVDQGEVGRLEEMISTKPARRFRPKVTINQMVALCARGEALPEETNDPSAGNCALLNIDRCAIYPVRPFGCRAMLSSVSCAEQGEAQMPSFMLAANNVIMQFIEAADQPGATGNLFDVMCALSDDRFREAYSSGQGIDRGHGLLVNLSIPVLMVPPEHRSSIAPLVESLNAAVREVQQMRAV